MSKPTNQEIFLHLSGINVQTGRGFASHIPNKGGPSLKIGPWSLGGSRSNTTRYYVDPNISGGRTQVMTSSSTGVSLSKGHIGVSVSWSDRNWKNPVNDLKGTGTSLAVVLKGDVPAQKKALQALAANIDYQLANGGIPPHLYSQADQARSKIVQIASNPAFTGVAGEVEFKVDIGYTSKAASSGTYQGQVTSFVRISTAIFSGGVAKQGPVSWKDLTGAGFSYQDWNSVKPISPQIDRKSVV